jgi:L-fuconolactonase
MTLVVDAHHHFWNPARRDYYWMSSELDAIRRPFGPEDLKPQLAASGVDRTIVVQTLSSLAETREFLASAAATDFVAGVVGWVDLADLEVGNVIAALQAGPSTRSGSRSETSTLRLRMACSVATQAGSTS